MTNEWKYLSATEIAKHVRRTLKEHWPTTKFSVRTSTYSGGASINVRWTDGPTDKMVDSLVGRFQSVSHMDVADLVHHKKVVVGGEEVSSGAHYIFTRRRFSLDHLRGAAAVICVDEGLDPDDLEYGEDEFNGAYIEEGALASRMIEDNRTIHRNGLSLNMGVGMTVASAIRAYAYELTGEELAEVARMRFEGLPLFAKVDKQGHAFEYQRMTPLRADRLNKELRDKGWFEQWVLDQEPVGASN